MKHRAFAYPYITLAVTALLLLPLSAGHAQLLVTGPVTPATPVLSTWYNQTLPPCFRAKDSLSLYPLDDRAMDAYLESVGLEDGASYASSKGNGEIEGLFANRQRRISVRTSPDGQVDVQTLTHEYGHYVWFHLFSRDDRKQYRAIYKQQSEARSLVSDYAETNLEEGFAEAFAFYLNAPTTLRQRDPASFQFLTDWITAADAHQPVN